MTSRSLASQKIFISDCEGPISKNDNAFELASHFIRKGDRLFTLISRYDDILADITKRAGYKAGDTLKLVLPFLKAYGVSNKQVTDFSSRNLILMPGAKEMLRFVRSFMPSYIVSTSYEQYMRALCTAVEFPFENVRCTHVDLNKDEALSHEKMEVKRLAENMVKLPMLEIPEGAQSISDLTKGTHNTLRRLDEIFWEEIPKMEIGKILSEVNPIGGAEKAAAVKDIMSKSSVQLENVMYTGDSITDTSALQMVREAGGLAVSFNGNNYALREAEVAVLSKNAIVTAVLANTFSRFGKARFITLVENWKPSSLEEAGLNGTLKEYFDETCCNGFPKVRLVTEQNMAELIRESTQLRKDIRGEAIGKLG